MQIIPRIEEFHDDLVNWRHDIHAHPELGFEERRTSDLVAEKLAGFGCEVHRGIGRTGVVGRLRIGNSSRSVGLKADMDALPDASFHADAARLANPFTISCLLKIFPARR
jgi:metal-dependent amidase/aminoacylase/carboxypeptidase family protein